MSSSSSSPSLIGRAILAVVLMVGFYVLALAIVALLLFILYAMVAYGQRINIRLTLFALIGAGMVLWSIIPRPDHFIPPGKRSQIVQIEIITETKSHDFKPDIQGNTPVVIFGSAHLDVSNINIESLYIENLAMRVIGKAHNLSTIVHVDDYEYPDLIVMFEDIGHFFNKSFSQATLRGNLSDGTIINGNDNIEILP